MARDKLKILVRVDQDVKDWISENAKQNMRSQSAEVAFVLREKMAADGVVAQK